MFSKTKFAMFALAAVVAVGAASLVSSSAEARGFGGGGFHGGGAMHMGGVGRVGIGHVGIGRVGFNRVGFNRVGFNHFNHFRRPIWNRWGYNHHRWWWWHHRRPILIGGGVVLGTTAYATSYAAPQAAAQPAPTCTCLTKQYTQDGLVVFQDVCTKEVASAPQGNTQAQLPMPPQPGQTQQQ